ncbi:TetR/AcrR family transcriptional regulator [Ornithinicoccus hortensis]|uniref:TetR family transcriptional regulator n=1 Tax=Ornithinicoccus hortensis TaxID=82346 RepID=A0A542YND5_9MICO|nr:TetR/AcrR family transcriptional regulator [Ornithinicoccus hortensis]TQL49622.1 TetR family transcriptional regulator [Ornithinicoccus hortensis]
MSPAPPANAADDRVLRLLWRHHLPAVGRRGPRPKHSVDDVVTAAIALADHGGLDGLSVRSVAQELGISTMSVYTHVPGKEELLLLMLDALYAELPRPPYRSPGWRSRVVEVAERNRQLLRDHPWATELAVLSRPSLGPGQTAKYEHELAALAGSGLADVQVDAALSLVLGFVQQQVRSEHDLRRAAAASGVSDQEWWAANGPLLAELVDPDDYPLAARIGTAAGEALGSAYAPDAAWEFGLARILDGLAALIDR